MKSIFACICLFCSFVIVSTRAFAISFCTKQLLTTVSTSDIFSELSGGELLISLGHFQSYFVHGSIAPKTILGLGQLRMNAFGAVGEGNGHLDTDKYDSNNFHVIVWDSKTNQIAAATRVGFRKQVQDFLIPKTFRDFYISESFDLDVSFQDKFLENALETSRTFVAPEYQRSLALKILFTSLAGVQNKFGIQKMFGLLSVSDAFNPKSLALITSYLEQFLATDAKYFHAHEPLTVGRVHFPSQLTFSQLLDRISLVQPEPRPSLNPLIKTYFNLGARLLGASRDRDFHTVDYLISLEINDIPQTTAEKFNGH